MPNVPSIELNDGRAMPQLGLGVFQIPPDRTTEVVAHALRVGYRSIDTAAMYGNEAEVARAIEHSDIERPEVFVATKLWNSDHGYDAALRAFERSLSRLRFDYVDLYLIHWPVPSQDRYLETWKALTAVHEDGRARSIGVSNFAVEHLERIIHETGVVPAVNQIELHPRLRQDELRQFHERHGIATEAWSPLGRGAALEDPTIGEIASRIARTPAQVILRWHLQLGNIAIPRSARPRRIEENFRLFDFSLSDRDMRAIAALDASARIGPDPRTFSIS